MGTGGEEEVRRFDWGQETLSLSLRGRGISDVAEPLLLFRHIATSDVTQPGGDGGGLSRRFSMDNFASAAEVGGGSGGGGTRGASPIQLSDLQEFPALGSASSSRRTTGSRAVATAPTTPTTSSGSAAAAAAPV